VKGRYAAVGMRYLGQTVKSSLSNSHNGDTCTAWCDVKVSPDLAGTFAARRDLATVRLITGRGI